MDWRNTCLHGRASCGRVGHVRVWAWRPCARGGLVRACACVHVCLAGRQTHFDCDPFSVPQRLSCRHNGAPRTVKSGNTHHTHGVQIVLQAPVSHCGPMHSCRSRRLPKALTRHAAPQTRRPSSGALRRRLRTQSAANTSMDTSLFRVDFQYSSAITRAQKRNPNAQQMCEQQTGL